MLITMLKGKLHRAVVTAVEPDYEGSCAIDEDFLEKAGLVEHEQIHIYNITNGERFITYAIKAPRNSGTISVNGAAARKVLQGDIVIIVAYAQMTPEEASEWKPKVFLM